MKISVSGSGGQLGQEFKHLAKAKKQKWNFLSHAQLDLCNDEHLRTHFLTERPDVFINCAAYTAVDQAESESRQAFMVNDSALQRLAYWASETGTSIVHFSTDYVYHNALRRPLKETDPTTPRGVYAKSKLAGEKHLTTSSSAHFVFRTSWVYGAYGHNFVHTMKRLMTERTELNIVNDQIGAPTYTGTIAEFVMAHLQEMRDKKAKPGIYNLSNSGECSWYGFAQEIRSQLNLECELHPIPTSAYPTPAQRPHYSVLDHSKILKAFPTASLPHWKTAFQDYLQAVQRIEADQ